MTAEKRLVCIMAMSRAVHAVEVAEKGRQQQQAARECMLSSRRCCRKQRRDKNAGRQAVYA